MREPLPAPSARKHRAHAVAVMARQMLISGFNKRAPPDPIETGASSSSNVSVVCSNVPPAEPPTSHQFRCKDTQPTRNQEPDIPHQRIHHFAVPSKSSSYSYRSSPSSLQAARQGLEISIARPQILKCSCRLKAAWLHLHRRPCPWASA